MTKLRPNFFGLLCLLLVQLTSCSEDDSIPVPQVGSEGFYIVNEGGFGNGNTSISFFDRSEKTMTNDVYFSANGIPLGDQAQSMTIYNGRGYIVVQNSSKIEVVAIDDFSSIATIDQGITSPRYFLGISATKAYVSDWGDGFSGAIKVVDLANNAVTSTINTGRSGPNKMVLKGDEVFVTNNGGFGRDSVITVINTSTDQVSRSIEVADNPNSIVEDIGGNLWVACSGYTAYDFETFEIIEELSTPGSLIQMNSSGNIQQELKYGSIASSFSNITTNTARDQIYFLFGGQIYQMSSTSSALPSQPFAETIYYGLAVDPVDGTIIGCKAPDFTNSGNIDFYNNAGTISNTFSVGIAPNGCTFL